MLNFGHCRGNKVITCFAALKVHSGHIEVIVIVGSLTLSGPNEQIVGSADLAGYHNNSTTRRCINFHVD